MARNARQCDVPRIGGRKAGTSRRAGREEEKKQREIYAHGYRGGAVESSDIRPHCPSSSSLSLPFRNVYRAEGVGEYHGRPRTVEGLRRRMLIVSRHLTLTVNFRTVARALLAASGLLVKGPAKILQLELADLCVLFPARVENRRLHDASRGYVRFARDENSFLSSWIRGGGEGGVVAVSDL